jgi:serine-type D-Ala-D-Ala carboxypeptidase
MPQEICFAMDRLAHAARIADDAVASGQHPGALIVVANSAERVWTHLAPGADGLSERSIFLLASISKPVTATAVMRLVEDGRLLLNLPVAHYIPEFGAHGKGRVTAWHLLTHTSGIEEERWFDELFGRDASQADYVRAACDSYLHFEPGERCEYSQLLGFAILAELITRLGGQPYPDYLREHIFAPLGMGDTAFQPVDPSRAAPVYDSAGPSSVDRFTLAAHPGGGLWSTASDLVAFGQSFLRNGVYNGYRLLGPAALDTMTRNYTRGMVALVDRYAEPFSYGLGWGKPDPNAAVLASDRAFGHGGATGTYLWVDPAWDLVFIFLTNRWSVGTDTARRVLNAVYAALELS